jgi:flagellar hook-length control protein FliK
MNVLMPMTAIGAPSTIAAHSPAVSATPAETASALPFDRTLQLILLGRGSVAGDASLTEPTQPEGSPRDISATDTLFSAVIDAQGLAPSVPLEPENATSGPVPDLLLSGMLLQPPVTPTAEPAAQPTAMPPTPALPPTLGQPQAPSLAPLAGSAPDLSLPESPASRASLASQTNNLQALAPAAEAVVTSAAAAAAVVPAPLNARPVLAQDPARLPARDGGAPSTAERSLSPVPSTAVEGAALPSRFAAPTGQATAPAPAQANPLMQALGERIALHMQRGSERVVIRLDPPLSGHIEINIRQDAGGLTQVQLSGSSPELVRQLQTISEGLRQELVHRQPGEVTVQVGHAMREHEGRQQRQERETAQADEPGRALDEQETHDLAQRFALADDRAGR